MKKGIERHDSTFKKCICAYGSNAQIDMAIEEMSELTKALLKWRRNNGNDINELREDIIDEIADVRIMCRQMEILYQQDDDEVEKRIDYKVERQIKRMEGIR